MVKRTVSPRLTELMGTVGAEARATVLPTVSEAVLTMTPVVSVAERVPMLVTMLAELKYVPDDVPALTVKMNVRVVLPGRVVPPGKVQEIVPVAPTVGEDDGAPSVPA